MIFIVSHVPGSQLPERIVFGLDKIIHLGLYFVLGFLILVGEGKRRKETFYVSGAQYFGVVIAILYGVLLEIYQLEMTQGRSFDFGDAIANAIGVILGWICFSIIYKRTLKYKKFRKGPFTFNNGRVLIDKFIYF